MRKTVSGIMLILISLGILAITPLVESLPIIEFEGYTDKPQYEPAETGTVYFWIYNLGPDSILLRNITILYPWYSNRTIANIDIALPKDGNYSNTDNFTIPNDSEEVHSSIQFQILYSVGSSTFSIWEFISINVIPYGTIYIRANGSVEGTDKITSTDNVTYTFTGDINGSIVVERDNIVIDGAGHMEQGTFQGSGNIPGIDLSNRNNVTIKNTIIQKFYDSIHIYDSSNNMIIGNNITNNFIGILLMGWSSNNSMSGNNVTDNNNGIYLGSSSNHNSVSENTFFNDGLTVWNSYGNVVVDNLVNGRPLVYLEGVSDYAVDDAGQVILVNCNNMLVENLDLSHTSVCVQLWGTSNTKISENNMTNGDGIWIYMSSNNSISGNNITDGGIAINIDSLSNDNSISGNNIANNGDGIWIFWSSNNNVSGNNIADNYYGVGLVSSSNNSISGNNITASNDYGIYLGSTSNNNSVSGNNIANNDGGIRLESSSNNRVYHNNLVGNAIQIDSYDSANTWDDGYPSDGNYWSDYTGTDLYRGPYQNETGSDGIGDSPYIIDENNQDNYPLMNPWTPTPKLVGDINGDGIVDIKDLVLFIKTFGSYPTHPRWNPEADLNDDYKVDIKDLVLVIKHFGEHI